MEEKYLGVYRIPSNRLKGWDYGNDGVYFITICTANRECFFWEVVNGEMVLNELGKTAEKLWLEIPQQFSFIELGKFVIMPNHIHGLLTVATQFIASCSLGPDAMHSTPDAINCVSTVGGFSGVKNPLLNQNIARVIRWYKGRCTFEMRKLHADFLWQTRFYDHIVRNQHSLKNIEDYIDSNPMNWKEDKLYTS
jgi:putative transposase